MLTAGAENDSSRVLLQLARLSSESLKQCWCGQRLTSGVLAAAIAQGQHVLTLLECAGDRCSSFIPTHRHRDDTVKQGSSDRD